MRLPFSPATTTVLLLTTMLLAIPSMQRTPRPAFASATYINVNLAKVGLAVIGAAAVTAVAGTAVHVAHKKKVESQGVVPEDYDARPEGVDGDSAEQLDGNGEDGKKVGFMATVKKSVNGVVGMGRVKWAAMKETRAEKKRLKKAAKEEREAIEREQG